MKQRYLIGDFCFQILSETDLPVPEMFRKFEVPSVQAAAAQENHAEAASLQKRSAQRGSVLSESVYTFRITLTEELPDPPENSITRREDLIIGKTDAGEYRLIGRRGTPGFYAYYEEKTEQLAEILLRRDYRNELLYDTVFSSLFALERHVMEKQQFILHCSYMNDQGQAILFSAPSGTGKTTQAKLWERYRGSRVVNGDRALLRFREDRLTACGWPVCGSSEVCENEALPVRAIVLLSQGKENQIRLLTAREAFLLLYSQVTINTWNPEFVNRAVDFLEQLLQSVPVYHLACTISEDAVAVLEAALKR